MGRIGIGLVAREEARDEDGLNRLMTPIDEQLALFRRRAYGERRTLAAGDGSTPFSYKGPMLDQASPDSANAALDAGHDGIREAHCAVLEMAVVNSPLEKTLGALIEIVESTSKTGVLGSILLLDADGRHLRHGAAPSLPAAYSAAIDGAEIGPCAGSCGTAAFSGKPVFVSDIATDPLWAEYKAIALPHGLHACWSTPIITSGRRVLGTFAMYHREPREPTVRDLALVDLVTQTAALVIDRASVRTALNEIEAIAARSAPAALS